MSILAIDLGKTLGWAADTSGGITSGVEDFNRRWSESAGVCMLRFHTWLDKMNGLLSITEIHYELVQGYRSGAAARVWCGFWSHLLAWCEKNQIPCSGVPVGTLKKYATGNGGCGKPAMIAAAKAKGWDPVDHNEADALWLLSYAVNVLKAGT